MKMRATFMPLPSDYERLQHIKEAVELIVEYTQSLDLMGFRLDRKLQLSVERLLEILGEAANRISPDVKTSYPDVPWREMTNLRNVVSHEYFQVRLELI
jgi:uncharacterized protein with HEPN domain